VFLAEDLEPDAHDALAGFWGESGRSQDHSLVILGVLGVGVALVGSERYVERQPRPAVGVWSLLTLRE
jgi:hypothetical protein